MSHINSILIHIGCSGPYIQVPTPPPWIEHCITQYLLFNEGPIYVLTDRANIKYLHERERVIPIAIEDYESDKVAEFARLYDYSLRNFWTVSATRFMYLENFLRDNELQHVYHFENDILIYFDLSKHHATFQGLYPNIAITPGGPIKTMTGFMYINNWQSLAHLTDFFIDTLASLGLEKTMAKYGLDMVHEMSLMVAYEREHGAERMAYLPTMPFGEHSQDFDKFNSIFDAAGFGTFVDGTIQGDPPGFRAPWLYVGQVLEEHPEYKVVWEAGCPYFSHDDNLVKINNLHIHTKKLERYMSHE